MEKKYILALDLGTTGARAVITDRKGSVISSAHSEFTQYYPEPGWVEQDPMEVWGAQIGAAGEAIEKAGIKPSEIAAIGITNQRETTVVWDKNTGKPVTNAIVWQCRRTSSYCEKLKREGYEKTIREKTGLLIDAYFSASKIHWILENTEGARQKAEKGELLFGTMDSWLIYKLTRGKLHITDVSNASRTLLYNIKDLKWDKELLEIFGVPSSMLPEVRMTSEIYGTTHPSLFAGAEIPIASAAGDQQAALFGHGAHEKGMVKNTYGTGCFLLMNTGSSPIASDNGLLTTIAWGIGGKITYALEGSVFMGGAVIKWLRDELKLIYDAEETQYYAERVEDTGGVYMVPAFTGLGAPWWDMDARGTVFGLTRGTKREHIVRAALESIAFQTKDVLNAMEEDSGIITERLKADGGASQNDFLMQFQADILGIPVVKSSETESTALGAAYLAGLAVGFYEESNLVSGDRKDTPGEDSGVFINTMDEETRNKKYRMWKIAVRRSMEWLREDEEE